jgi:tetratricopeptide (TPR) repeat protein
MSKRHHRQTLPGRVPFALPNTLKIQAELQNAITLHQRGRLVEAELLYRNILRMAPNDFNAQHLLGVLKHQQGQNAEALKLIKAALRQRPNEVVALANCGAVLNELRRFDETLAVCAKAIALKPDHAEAHNNCGLALKELKRAPEALASFERAITLKPNYVDALNNRGTALHALRRFEEALASYDAAIALRPNYAEALNNRGITRYELKRLGEALTDFDKAIALKPQYAHAHWNRAQLRLLTGDFDRGWAEHEWRLQSNAFLQRDFPQPLWLGNEAIDGKTILLHAEQGLGDTIQFCRYVPLVAERGARVILEVQDPLRRLVSGLAGAAQIISKGDPLPAFDCQCPLLSLPLALQTRLETVPSRMPYLHALPEASNDWAALLGPKSRPRIGIAWSGNPGHRKDQDRSISLHALLPLLTVDATFVSLQKDVRPAEVALLDRTGEILDFATSLNDFSDTAALLSRLDLVVTVDTSIAHLAGALGKPVWVLLSYVPDWRWLLDRDDSPWYPTARLFRQDDSRTWDGAITRVREAAGKFLQGGLSERGM